MSGELAAVYATVDKNKDKSSQQPHQEPVRDVYAVVDKTKKIGNKGKSSPSQDLSHAYAVLENIKQIKSERNGKGDCDVGPAGKMFTTDNAIQYDFTSVPVYEEVDHYTQESASKNVREHKNEVNREIQNTSCKYPVIVASCLTVLITAVVVAAVAVVIALALIAGLHSELNSVMKNHELSQSNFKQKLNQLQHDFYSFSSNTSDLLVGISRNTSNSSSNWRQKSKIILRIMQNISEAMSQLRMNMRVINNTFNEEISYMENVTSLVLRNYKKELSENITVANSSVQTSINILSDRLARGIQALHIFDSCVATLKLSVLLPSGIYKIRSGNTSIDEYCSTSIAFSCNDIPGRWKRIAYLNTDENPVTCPDGFEVRSDTSTPPLCRRMDTSAGCSSVIYPSNGASYSQVCGTVRVHPAGTPDGFNTMALSSLYADGVSLTYGNSSNRRHIWTYTAVIYIDSSRECDICNYKRHVYPGNNFTCFTARCYDGVSCYPDTLWGNEVQQCFGNETFYRQLSESTTDDIEMKVCRDQSRLDEDILLSFVEMFVM